MNLSFSHLCSYFQISIKTKKAILQKEVHHTLKKKKKYIYIYIYKINHVLNGHYILPRPCIYCVRRTSPFTIFGLNSREGTKQSGILLNNFCACNRESS